MIANIEAPLPGHETASRRPGRGIALMVAGVSLVALMDLLVKFTVPELGVAQIAWARYGVQLLALLALAWPGGVLSFLRAKLWRLHLARAFILLAGNLAFITALRHMPLVQANLIGFLSPLLLTALAYPVLGEPVGTRRALAVIVGFAGVLVVLRPWGQVFGWEALLPLTMAVCAATYHIMTPIVRRVEDPAISLTYLSVIAVAATTAMMPWSWVPLPGAQWMLLVCIGLLSVSGHILMIRALEAAPASSLSPFFYCHLLWALVFDAVFFGLLPGVPTLLGAVLVVGSGLYVYRTR